MTTDQERAAFEAFWLTRNEPRPSDFVQLSDGTYAQDHVQRHWWTWQNATARQASELEALRLKLDTAYAVVIDLGGEVREPELDEQRRLRADAEFYRYLKPRMIGAEYMGQREMVCCGCPEPSLLNDRQIVASLRERFPVAATQEQKP